MPKGSSEGVPPDQKAYKKSCAVGRAQISLADTEASLDAAYEEKDDKNTVP